MPASNVRIGDLVYSDPAGDSTHIEPQMTCAEWLARAPAVCYDKRCPIPGHPTHSNTPAEMDADDERALLVPCREAICKAISGDSCRTATGDFRLPHAVRVKDAKKIPKHAPIPGFPDRIAVDSPGLTGKLDALVAEGIIERPKAEPQPLTPPEAWGFAVPPPHGYGGWGYRITDDQRCEAGVRAFAGRCMFRRRMQLSEQPHCDPIWVCNMHNQMHLTDREVRHFK
jgi:hypothetical protein